jgi:hypothetical protein
LTTNQEWRELLRKAQEFDINAGGYADPRGGCINFWVGPDNKPIFGPKKCRPPCGGRGK